MKTVSTGALRRLLGREKFSFEVLGFFATRWIEADSEVDAQCSAIKKVSGELSGLNVLANPENDPPKYWVDKIIRVIDFPARRPPVGFTFYPDAGLH